MQDVVIVAARRTAVGAFGGSLAGISAADLGAHVIKDILASTGVSGDQVDEVLLGQVLTAGCGQNPARQTVIKAGLPEGVPAMTINKVCGSGLKALHLATQAIRCGDAQLILAGGQENMSLSPHVLPNSRNGKRMGDWKAIDTMVHDGLWDAFNDIHMGITAENLAEKYEITREAQDAFAAASQQKACEAIEAGRFKSQIVPVEIPQRKGDPIVFDTDENPRAGTTVEKLAGMRPAFKKDGTVTAGNASALNDGAAVVMLCSADKARELGLTPLATIKAYSNAGVDPKIMGIGPAPATRLCLKKAGWSLEDLDLVEANEAFAAQACAVMKELGMDPARVNPNGSGISLGHPVGATGAIITVKAIHELLRVQGRYALVTMCIGGGQGIAAVFERC